MQIAGANIKKVYIWNIYLDKKTEFYINEEKIHGFTLHESSIVLLLCVDYAKEIIQINS